MSSNPVWWKDARLLQYLLTGAWAEVSSGFFAELREAFKEKDVARAEKLLKSVNTLGPMMVKAVGRKSKAILTTVQNKSQRSWKRDIRGQKTLKAADDKYQQFIIQRIDRQVARFLESHPDRILTPQIEKEIGYLKESELTTTSDIADLMERLECIAPQTQYWQNLSTVQISRQWHADGVLRARDEGITKVVITGPIDSLTCPVCRRLVGLEYDIDAISGKVEGAINLEDIDEYISAFPFPRIHDVDNLSRQELAAKLFFPPFHPNCRHSIALLSR